MAFLTTPTALKSKATARLKVSDARVLGSPMGLFQRVPLSPKSRRFLKRQTIMLQMDQSASVLGSPREES